MVLLPGLWTGSLLRSGKLVRFPSLPGINFPRIASGLSFNPDNSENDLLEPSTADTLTKINSGDTQSRTLRVSNILGSVAQNSSENPTGDSQKGPKNLAFTFLSSSQC